MKTHEPLSGVDAAWLRMDNPTNLMTITAVLVLEDPLDVDTLKELLEERFLGFTRFKQRVRDPEGSPYWELDPHFDLDRHVQRSALPGDAGRTELKRRVSELMREPLDREKPLWHMELIEEFLGGSAVIVRLHHCIGDGMALVQVLLSLTDEHFDASRFPETEDDGPLLPSLVRGTKKTLRGVASAGATLLSEGGKSLVNPKHALKRAKQGWSVGAALKKFLSLRPDADTSLKGELDVAQNATWSAPLDLGRVKRMGRVLDAKVNDLLLGAVAGAFRSYFESRDELTDDLVIRTLIPVNLRNPERAFELGNEFGLAYLDLPVGTPDRLERVVTVKKEMDEIKDSAEAVTAFGVIKGLGYVPLQMEEWVVQLLSKKASVVMTNVPGPQEPLHLKGRRIEHIMPWVPRAGRIGVGVSIFSYDGDVRLGIACDAGLVPDPDAIQDGFMHEFDELGATLLPEEKREPESPSAHTPEE